MFFLFRPGTKTPASDFSPARPLPAVIMTAHVADSQRSLRPAVQKQARAQIAKGNGLGGARQELTNGKTMESPTIDDTHIRAICDEIGERLRALLKWPTPGGTAELEDKLHQLITWQPEGGGSA
jgi:hypothetical protein